MTTAIHHAARIFFGLIEIVLTVNRALVNLFFRVDYWVARRPWSSDWTCDNYTFWEFGYKAEQGELNFWGFNFYVFSNRLAPGEHAPH
ncbi:hypothetical protein BH09PSE5_BH09PSE5_06920 [soil metagenome]